MALIRFWLGLYGCCTSLLYWRGVTAYCSVEITLKEGRGQGLRGYQIDLLRKQAPSSLVPRCP
jgi:hypothetical protein